jgi:hypothetical protein
MLQMSAKTMQKELLDAMARLFGRFGTGGDLTPATDHWEWEKIVESRPADEGRVLQELARFADFWRYFQQRSEKLGPEIVDAISDVHNLPVSERIERLKEINQKLMERVGDAGEGAQFRH